MEKLILLTGRPREYFELLSALPILEYTAAGFSVSEIALLLAITEEEVRKSLLDHTGFDGIDETLDKSPALWYNNRDQFNKMFSNYNKQDELYKFLQRYFSIRKELDTYEPS